MEGGTDGASLPTHPRAVLGCLDRSFPDYPNTAGSAPSAPPSPARRRELSSARTDKTQNKNTPERHRDRSLYPRGLGCPEGQGMLRESWGRREPGCLWGGLHGEGERQPMSLREGGSRLPRGGLWDPPRSGESPSRPERSGTRLP